MSWKHEMVPNISNSWP